jgi:hypothetical protein
MGIVVAGGDGQRGVFAVVMLLIEGTGGGVSMTAAPVADRSGSIYRLRVVLAGISPLIWRQVEVPDSITIAGLHEVL